MSKNEHSISKMNLLSGDIRGKNSPQRPPWAVDESLFDDLCTNCGDCITACPENILTFARGQLPVVNFSFGECAFCAKCEVACKANALDSSINSQPWEIKAVIADSCLSKQKVTCRTCEDQCQFDAIHFKLAVGGVATPEISIQNCNGCGACFALCPTHSISIIQHNQS